MKNRLSSRLRLTLSGVTLLTLLLMCALVFAGMYFQTTADNREQLRQQAAQLSAYLDASDDPVSLLEGSVFTQRVTYLDTDGTVLYDSEVDASRLESHAGREEFQQARENGEAFTARSSATLGQTSLYYAKRLADGRVIRVSGTQRGMLRQVRDLLGYLLLGAVLCFGAAMAFSRPLAKRLAAPMNEVNLDQPLESDVYEELSPMLRRMAQQNARIADQMASLTAQRHELDTVLGGMKEGFVILDEKRHVLTMNNAARAMFCITNDPVGQPMIAVSRDEALLRLLDGQGTECAMQLNGMTIHLSRSHVEGGGTALLMQDVTAAQAAEASRRQFSANVSHELRTPLTTISGYAELLSSGMLQKPEDATEFGRKILAESRRLLTLIEDIIRLSRLDEGVRGEVTPVDLTALIQHCVQKLTPAAQNAQVSISASGNDPVLISGDHALLEEMLTNLLENGIKYNHAGGYVRVRAEMADGLAVVTVADNGVGIAPEDQQRVFERFYRVDKSRSKQTGGTGLGLSIVKHGAQVHHAQIAMQSALGEGTTITLTFPAQSSGKNNAAPTWFPPESHRPLRRPPRAGGRLFLPPEQPESPPHPALQTPGTPACRRITPPPCGPPSASSGKRPAASRSQTTRTPSAQHTARDRQRTPRGLPSPAAGFPDIPRS